MPRMMKLNHRSVPVATEQELLDFANRLRAAGNADLLDALLPSKRTNSTQCLIARALNFQSTVHPVTPDGTTGFYADGSDIWGMRPARVPRLNISARPDEIRRNNEKVRELAKAAKLRVITETEWFDDGQAYKMLYIKLPKHIGNAAAAFDNGQAFQDFIEKGR